MTLHGSLGTCRANRLWSTKSVPMTRRQYTCRASCYTGAYPRVGQNSCALFESNYKVRCQLTRRQYTCRASYYTGAYPRVGRTAAHCSSNYKVRCQLTRRQYTCRASCYTGAYPRVVRNSTVLLHELHKVVQVPRMRPQITSCSWCHLANHKRWHSGRSNEQPVCKRKYKL